MELSRLRRPQASRRPSENAVPSTARDVMLDERDSGTRMMILDTSFMIDVLRGNPDVIAWEQRIGTEVPGIATTISVMELWEGTLLAAATREERDRVNSLLSDLHVAVFDSQSARRAAEIEVQLLERGTPIDIEDVMIAGVAKARDEPVLTGNPTHFEHVDGLVVKSY